MNSLGIDTGANRPVSCFEEPLWQGIPVCTVNCPGNHCSNCPDYQSATSLFDRSARLPLTNACIDFIKYTIGCEWLPLAVKLGFSDEETDQLTKKYLGIEIDQHAARQVKVPGFVFLLEDLIRTALTHKGVSAEAIFAALDGYDGVYMTHAFFTELNNQMLSPVDLSLTPGGRFESYVFLIWIKKDQCSAALPNTIDCPVRQRCYDWANHNPDKLVVLWFSSSMLDVSSDDHCQLLQFQNQCISQGITNLIILDIDDIQWGGEKRFHCGDRQELICDSLRFDGEERFFDVIDRLRIVLLSRGSTYIKSAMKTPSIPKADIPTRGAYFDVDYTPVPFSTFYHPTRPLCRDGTFDKIGFQQGALRIYGMIPNSFFAVSEEGHEAIVNFPIDYPYGTLGVYARRCPHLVATTRVFRMSDCRYTADGSLIDWCRERTWGEEYVDGSVSCSLSPAAPAIPAYLHEFRKTPQATVDPMVRL